MSDAEKPVSFGDLVRRYRLDARLTQAALAERAEISQRAVQDLERSVGRPQRETARRLAEALALTAERRVQFDRAAAPIPRVRRMARGEQKHVTMQIADGAGSDRGWLPAPGVTPHHNLPAHRVHLFGRKRDLAIARTELLASEGRLLTMTGTGGCGKTHLALALADSLLNEFEEGVWLVELAPLEDPALVPQLVVSTIGLRERSGESLVQTLVRWIGARQLLLVLDNCEHLIDRCAQVVERLLDACPSLRIIATSREPLRVPGELAWRVPSLQIPHPNAPPGELLESPAVQLFAERACRVRPDFNLTDDSLSMIAAICRRLEGVPLALELAAARARTLGVHQILARLDTSIGLLAGGGRTAPTRQQSMRATLDWSYGLLSPAERHLICRVAVFADTGSLESVEWVCSASDGDPGDTVLETLDRLVDKSMVLAEEREGLVRYRMLEPIRQYASEQLQASGAYSDARQRHLEYFVAYGEQREQASNIGGERRLAATAEIEREYPNIRLALDWAIEAGEAQLGLRLVRTVQYFWQVRGIWGEGVAWCEQLLALPGAGEATAAHTAALLTAGRLAGMQGRLDLAATFYERGLPLARQSPEYWVRWVGPENAGLLAFTRGEPARAGELFREARAVAETAGDRSGEATSLHMMAFAAWCESRFEVARAYAEKALRAHRQIAHQWGECISLVILGFASFSLDAPSAARRHFEDALTLARRQSSPVWIGFALDGLGWVASRQGRLKESQSHLIASLDLRREFSAHANIAESLDSVAGLAARSGHPLRACQLAGAAEALRQHVGQTLAPARRQMRESCMTGVYDDLGEQAAEAFSAGTQLSLDEAIALAHEADEPVAVAPQLDAALTRRERQVVVLLARGLSNPQIADELVISPRTAQRHVENILGKLGFGSRAQVAAWGVSNGLVAEVAAVQPC